MDKKVEKAIKIDLRQQFRRLTFLSFFQSLISPENPHFMSYFNLESKSTKKNRQNRFKFDENNVNYVDFQSKFKNAITPFL